MPHFTKKEDRMRERQRKQKRERRGYTAAELAKVWDRWGDGSPRCAITPTRTIWFS